MSYKKQNQKLKTDLKKGTLASLAIGPEKVPFTNMKALYNKEQVAHQAHPR